jgi:Fe2+ transport system protein FeoA
MMQENLKNLKSACVGYVTHIGGNYAIKRHMQNAGFRVGVKIVVLNVTPYTSNYLLDVGGRVKAIKKMAVSLITVSI